MFKHNLNTSPGKIVFLHWFLLSFNAGCINAGGFIAAGRFVSHVTGFATLFGIDLVERQYGVAIGMLLVPGFFLLGAMLTGFLVDRQIYLDRRPRFDYVMLLCSICLVVVAVGGRMNQFGSFGDIHDQKHFFMLALLCLSCGLQNAAITSSSGSSIRTTHLTGLTTDLGLGIARHFTMAHKPQPSKNEITANRVRAGTILFFFIGSALGSWLFLRFQYAAFCLPALISLYASWNGRIASGSCTAHRF